MSAPVEDEVLRELDTGVRQFGSVMEAMLWYITTRPSLKAISYEMGGIGTSELHKNTVRRTLGLVARCLVYHDPAYDLDDAPRHDLVQYRKAHWRKRLEILISWYVQSSAKKGEPFIMRGIQRIADEMDMTPVEASKYCGETEQVIRRRMRGRGLFLER